MHTACGLRRRLKGFSAAVATSREGYALTREGRLTGRPRSKAMPADLKRLHKYMLEVEGIDHISDEMRAVVEREWPELAHKLPPKRPRG